MRAASGALINFLASLDPHFLYADLFTFTQNPTATVSTPLPTGPLVQIQQGISTDGNAFGEGLDQENLLSNSQDFELAAWTTTLASVTADNVTDPLGSTTADTVNYSSSGTGATLQQFISAPLFSVASTPFCFSVYLKVPSGSPTLSLLIEDQTGAVVVVQAFTLSTSWQRFSVAGTMGSGATGIRCFIYNPSASGNYHVWGAQLEFNWVPISGTPSPYMASRDTVNSLNSAYSGALLGTSAIINGVTFNFAAAGGYSAGWGETVALTAGKYNSLQMLGTAVNGAQTAQTFTVNYTDSTHDTFVQSFSDWFIPQSFPGEGVGKIFPYRNLSNGTRDNRVFYLYLYSFSLNPNKTVLNVVMPNNRNVVALAMTLVASGGRKFYFTNSDVDIIFNNNTYRSGRDLPSLNLVPDSDGFDLDWSVVAGVPYSTIGGANGGGSWIYTGTGSPSSFLFPISPQFNLIPGLVYIASGFIDSTQVTGVNIPALAIYDPQISINIANQGQGIGTSGRPYGPFLLSAQVSDNFPNRQLASDNFTRANANPIGGNWTTGASFNPLQIVSNAVESTLINNFCASYYNAVTWPNDQYSQVTVGALSSNNDFVGAAVRIGAAGSANCYVLFAQGPLGATGIVFIQKVVAGVQTNLVTLTSHTITAGDVFRIEVNGITITALQNGVQIMQVTDTSIASGNAGMAIDDVTTIGNGTITAWVGGATDPNPNQWAVVVGNMEAARGVVFGGSSNAARANMAYLYPLPPDQYAQLTIATLPASFDGLGPAVRCDSRNANYYGFYVTSGNAYFLFRVINNVVTVLKSGSLSIVVNDVLRLEVVGNTLTAKKNGAVVDTAVDFSLLSGFAGIQTEPNNPVSLSGKTFLAGGMGYQTPVPLVYIFDTDNATVNNNQILRFSNPQVELMMFDQLGNQTGTGSNQLVSDPFSGSALSVNWTVVSGTFSVAGGVVTAATFGTGNYAIAAYTGITFSNDQYSQVIIGATPTGDPISATVRSSNSVQTCYYFNVNGTNNTWTIAKLVTGTPTNLLTGTYTPKIGDQFTLCIIGTTLYGFINGLLVGSIADSSISSGIPGMLSFSPTPVQSADTFAAGNIGPSPYWSSSYTPLFERQQITWKTGLEASRVVLKVSAIGQNLITGVSFLKALLAGKFDDALVSVDRLYMQSPGDTSLGTVNLFVGNIGEIRNLGRTTGEFDVDSKLQKLSQPMPRNYYQASCRWTLYDTGCSLSKAAFGINGSILAGSNLQILQTNLGSVDNYFNQGTITFTSGQNNGLTFSVRLYKNAGGQITIYTTLPFPAAVGDTFTAYPGCDKSQSTCLNKFSNLVNFAAEPYIPVPELAV